MNKYKLVLIFFISILFFSCSNKYFIVKVQDQDYDKIHNLIIEINDKALKNDYDYFKRAVGISEIIENNKTEYYDMWRETYKKEDYSYEEIIEYVANLLIDPLIYEIIRADIVKTYRRRAYVSNEGINFNYHWDRKNVHFQMYIKMVDKIYEYENATIYGYEWILYDIWNCR